MKTREVLRELLFRSNLKASGLAEKLQAHGVQQAQLSRFTNGVTKEPKRSTLAPVADYFGINVDVFFDEERAEALLRQIETGEFVVKRSNRAGALMRPDQATALRIEPARLSGVSLEDGLRAVAVALDQADASDRNAAKAYLVELCDKPKEVDTFAAKLQRLLTPLPVQANAKNY